jgi:hypothetical protein
MRVLRLFYDLKRWRENDLLRKNVGCSSGVSLSLLLLQFIIPASVWGTHGMVTDKRKHKPSGNTYQNATVSTRNHTKYPAPEPGPSKW